MFKKGYVAKFTNLRNERGELVNDKMGPDTCADYFEKMHWARNNEIDNQRQEDPDITLTYGTEADVKQDSFTKGLDKAINTKKLTKHQDLTESPQS